MQGLNSKEQLIDLVSKCTLDVHNDPYDCIKCQNDGIACMANFFAERILIKEKADSIKEKADSMSKVLVVMSEVKEIKETLLHRSFIDIWSENLINVMIYIDYKKEKGMLKI